jgi:hypothetical protein
VDEAREQGRAWRPGFAPFLEGGQLAKRALGVGEERMGLARISLEVECRGEALDAGDIHGVGGSRGDKGSPGGIPGAEG